MNKNTRTTTTTVLNVGSSIRNPSSRTMTLARAVTLLTLAGCPNMAHAAAEAGKTKQDPVQFFKNVWSGIFGLSRSAMIVGNTTATIARGVYDLVDETAFQARDIVSKSGPFLEMTVAEIRNVLRVLVAMLLLGMLLYYKYHANRNRRKTEVAKYGIDAKVAMHAMTLIARERGADGILPVAEAGWRAEIEATNNGPKERRRRSARRIGTATAARRSP